MSENSTVRVDAGVEGYDVLIGRGVLSQAGAYLTNTLPSKKICIVTDETVAKIHLEACEVSLRAAGFTLCPTIVLPSGEGSKNFAMIESIINACASQGMDRQSSLLALGGGVVGDVAGFAASIYMRGIPFVQAPTTLLAQVDSSVGGKTGINIAQAKNMAGCFYQPKAVLVDVETLKTLPARELKAGYAEILKHALINDASFFAWLEQNGVALLAGDAEKQVYAIEASCRIKAAIVVADPQERNGARAVLNLGHTFAHALEALGGYDGRLLHGEAVSIGLLWAYAFSEWLGLCPDGDALRVVRHVQKAGLVCAPPFDVSEEDIISRMKSDKKNRNGGLTFILTKGIGQAFVSAQADEAALRTFLQESLKDKEKRWKKVSGLN